MSSFLAAFSARQKSQEQSNQNSYTDELTKEEIQLLIETMKNSTFKGEFVEIFYTTVTKLQNQYIKLQQKQ
jgi:response regulator RpfG family c-di-GMP phosphodiesterase